MSYPVEGKFSVGCKYMICTGTIGTNAVFRGVTRCKGSSERVLLFENVEARGGQYRYIGAIIDLHLPYHTESTVQVTGQLYAKYYGMTPDNLKDHGISKEEWELV